MARCGAGGRKTQPLPRVAAIGRSGRGPSKTARLVPLPGRPHNFPAKSRGACGAMPRACAHRGNAAPKALVPPGCRRKRTSRPPMPDCRASVIGAAGVGPRRIREMEGRAGSSPRRGALGGAACRTRRARGSGNQRHRMGNHHRGRLRPIGSNDEWHPRHDPARIRAELKAAQERGRWRRRLTTAPASRRVSALRTLDPPPFPRSASPASAPPR